VLLAGGARGRAFRQTGEASDKVHAGSSMSFLDLRLHIIHVVPPFRFNASFKGSDFRNPSWIILTLSIGYFFCTVVCYYNEVGSLLIGRQVWPFSDYVITNVHVHI
jgi:hypothetical protein